MSAFLKEGEGGVFFLKSVVWCGGGCVFDERVLFAEKEAVFEGLDVCADVNDVGNMCKLGSF